MPIELHLQQAHFRFRATRYTRGFHGGIGLDPARAWFYIEAPHNGKALYGIYAASPWPPSSLSRGARLDLDAWTRNEAGPLDAWGMRT